MTPDDPDPSTGFTDLALPDALRRALPVARWQRVSLGESGAGVWLSSRYALKVQARGGLPASTLRQERERLRWFASRLPVPGVVAYEVTATHEYLATTRLRGLPLSDPDATVHPERVVSLLARALRELHALPLRDCPFTLTLPVRLAQARERVAAGVVNPSAFHVGAQGRSAVGLFNDLVRTRPPHEDLVVTHGDACLPNFMVNGEWLEGLLDLGRAGIADRHQDLALAWRSTRRNLNADFAEQFLDLYGRDRVDEAKLAYYALLDDLF